MSKSWKALKRARLSTEARARVQARVAAAVEERTLKALRQDLALTQAEVGQIAAMTQSELSRLEGREDHLTSTLRRYVEALGGKLEVTASQRDRDYIAAIDWRAADKAAAAGQGDLIGGVRVLDPAKIPGLVYLMPCGKSPHGVDVSPDGRYIVGSGKLQGVTTAFDFQKVLAAIENHDFAGEEDGIPVLRYEAIKEAEVPVGLAAPP